MTGSLFMYFRLDRLWQAMAGYAAYRAEATRCFFSAPRLGHDWEGGGLYASCKRCPRVFIGNV